MEDKIKCPNCAYSFDVEDALSGQIEEKYKKMLQEQMHQQAEKFRREKQELEQLSELKLQQLHKEREEFEEKKRKANEAFKDRLEKRMREERLKIEAEQQKENELVLVSLREELEKKQEENRQFKQKEINLLTKQQELESQQKELEITLKKKMLEERSKIEEDAIKKEREAYELEKLEWQKQLDDSRKLAEEMKRKAEQGSMQLQGEVQELAIEEYLAQQFPFDTIEEIKKGQRGGDCIQTVNTRNFSNCGTIYYESKRTKNFSVDWIEKFKKDMQVRSSTIGVLVTEAMPNDMERMGMKNGIWICNFQEFKGLCKVLRESLILLKKNVIVQENKGDKMSLLYDYLTGDEFRMQIESIVDAFTTMKSQLEAEKRSMLTQWKRREKQIDRVIESTVGMYGSVKGIAGSAVQTIGSLELPEAEEEIE